MTETIALSPELARLLSKIEKALPLEESRARSELRDFREGLVVETGYRPADQLAARTDVPEECWRELMNILEERPEL